MSKRRHIEGKVIISGQTPSGSLQIPQITHLQFLALDLLLPKVEGLSAQELNAGILEFVSDYKGPKFYQLMGRLVEAKLVTSWSQEFDAGGTSVARTYYQIAPSGKAAWQITTEFYRTRLSIRGVIST